MKTSLQSIVFAATLATALLRGQPFAPAPVPQAASTQEGSIAQFNYGPNGRAEGFILAPNTLVSLPPDWAMQVEVSAKVGDQVRVTGPVSPTASGMPVMEAQTVNFAGRSLTLTEPSAPAPYAGSGTIRQLNYGRQGEVNGFVLDNGVIARTPPFGAGDMSMLKQGAAISLSGFAQLTPSGRTVVEVQSLTANGGTIVLNADRGPGPGPGPRDRRGPRGAAPPPPPAARSGFAPDAPPPPPPPPQQ
jgi:hypothetical protein